MFPLFLTAQDSYPLTISSGNSLVISQGAKLNIVGMELIPDAQYTLSGDATSQVSLTNSSETLDNTQTMSKVFGFDQALTAFSGTIVYNYDDTIINDINSASTALFIYDAASSTWSEYADQDNEDYTVTYNFDGSIPMSKLTAGGLGTLAIDENYSYGIGVYPNPVSSTLNITGLENSTSYLYNSIGQLVLSSNMSTIDLNSFDRGAYILVVEDENKNQTNFKILKK
tara:strand:+ start:3461 stop:4141 length:681 start_codon:yes stop_codon:yes gene_type:complete